MGLVLLMVALAQIDAPQAAPAVRKGGDQDAPKVQQSAVFTGKKRGDQPAILTKVADPYDAAAWAVQDALALRTAGQSAKHCLYVWIGPEERAEIAKINSLAVNSCLSHSSTIQLPELTAGGRLIRWDLSKLAPKPADFPRLVGVVNSLAAGEPFWHVDLKALGLKPAKVNPYLWLDGKTYTHASSVPTEATSELYQILQAETGLHAPLLRADYLLRKISSSVQNGVYLEARGFAVYERGKRRLLSEKEILETIGASTALSRKVQGDDRVGIVRSGITGQARAIEFIQGAVGPVRMSYDRSSDNEKLDAHPLYNLLSVVDRADGKETIFTLPNGLLGYIATNGKGEQVEEVPATIATDHRTPAPHPARLYPPLSCLRCHGPDGGVKRTPNDVATLLRRPADLDAFADFGGTGLTRVDVDRLAGLYSGDFEIRARDARNHYADAVFKATRGMTAAEAAAAWSGQYEAYWHAPVTAERQLLDIGYRARSPQAVNKSLEALLIKPEKDLLVFGAKLGREDPLLVAPRLNVPIRRQDSERLQPEAFRRAFLHRGVISP